MSVRINTRHRHGHSCNLFSTGLMYVSNLRLRTRPSLLWRLVNDSTAVQSRAFNIPEPSRRTTEKISENILPFKQSRWLAEPAKSPDFVENGRPLIDPMAILRGIEAECDSLKPHCITISGPKLAASPILMFLPLRLDHTVSFTLGSRSSELLHVNISLVENMAMDTSSAVMSKKMLGDLSKLALGTVRNGEVVGQHRPCLLNPDVPTQDIDTWYQSAISPPLSSDMDAIYLVKPKRENLLHEWTSQISEIDVKNYEPQEKVLGEPFHSTSGIFAVCEVKANSRKKAIEVGDFGFRGTPAAHASFMPLLPSIWYMLVISLRAQTATQRGPLRDVGFTNSRLVAQALTSSSALAQNNQESLEFLGDSLLKYYAAVQIYFDNPLMTEAELSNRYQTLVKRSRAHQAIKELGLDAYVTIEPFSQLSQTTRGQGEGHDLRKIPSKTLADVVKALIGAAHADKDPGAESEDKVVRTLKLLIPEVDWKSPTEHVSKYHQKGSAARANIAQLKDVEAMLNYKFKNKALLVDALTRTSLRAGPLAFERLEFLGDAILDRIVNAALYDSKLNLDVDHMKNCQAALVNRWLLAYLALDAKHVVNTDHIPTTTTKTTTTATDNETTPANPSTKTIRLVDHMRTPTDKADQLHRRRAETTYLAATSHIAHALHTGTTYPWPALLSIHTPKTYSDLIEALLAAIYIDSTASLAACTQTLTALGLIPLLRRITTTTHTEPEFGVQQPIEILTNKYPGVSRRESVSGKLKNGTLRWRCEVWFRGERVVGAESTTSFKHAEALAAVDALAVIDGMELGEKKEEEEEERSENVVEVKA